MKNKDIVFLAKGNAFSEASADIMKLLAGWLEMSGVLEEELLSAVKCEKFRIEYKCTKEAVKGSFFLADVPYGVPFICQSVKNIDRFNMDFALLLMCIASKSNDMKIQERFMQFIKENIIV